MALDHELPVWSVRPNWQQSVLETLEWRTDVLQSLSGAEQRIASRPAPRRMVEARYNPHENERTFVDLALQRLGRNEWMMPLWFDRSALTAPAVLAGTRIDCATEFHEFTAGGMAYLVGPDAFSGEAVRIETVDSTGLDLAAPLGAAWPAGTKIHPMRRGRFDPPSQSLIVSRLSEVVLRFVSVEGNALAEEGTWATTHSGFPVMDRKPEWSQRQEIDLSFLGESFDPGLGKLRLRDTAGRAFRTQNFASILHGAREQFEFRQMLYRLRGQQNGLWLPTYADDFTVAVSASVGATQIDVQQAGYSYVGGPASGRDHLIMPNGQIVRVNSVSTPSPGVERIVLATATTAALAAGDRLSFIETARLAQDSVEIEHIGDQEGVARSVLSFKAFANRRTATAAVQAHPAASMNFDQCGSPADGATCSVWEPPFQLPVGVYFMATLSMPGNTQVVNDGSLIIDVNGHGGLISFSQGGTGFPDTGADRQYAVSADRQTVICYFTKDIAPPSELYLQMQGLGGVANSITFNGNGPLMTRASQIFNPGQDSAGGNGVVSFGPGGLFPARRYFGV